MKVKWELIMNILHSAYIFIYQSQSLGTANMYGIHPYDEAQWQRQWHHQAILTLIVQVCLLSIDFIQFNLHSD